MAAFQTAECVFINQNVCKQNSHHNLESMTSYSQKKVFYVSHNIC